MESNDRGHESNRPGRPRGDVESRPPSPVVIEDEAEHLGEEFRETRDACRTAVLSTPGVHHVAHYSSGVYDFAIDVLDDPVLGPGLQSGRNREELRRLGRQLSFVVSGLDRTLQEVRTGGLIRTVLHTEQGAAFCNSVMPREYVVGAAIDHSAAEHPDAPLTDASGIRTADKAVSELATLLRRRIRMSPQNPGGWASEEPIEPALPDDESAEPRVSMAEPIAAGARTGQVVDACRRAVRPADLHLVAYCSHSDVVLVVDHLEHPSLRPFFTQITVEARRKFYLGFSRELGVLTARLNRIVAAMLGGLLVRLVLDVEQGAIYYYRLGAGEYLAGVTIDQGRVRHADERMAHLALACRP